jgi:hypothetical protein
MQPMLWRLRAWKNTPNQMKYTRNEAVGALIKLRLEIFEAFLTEIGKELWIRHSPEFWGQHFL